tara:strand:- start:67448 stop:68191 length:744 start_codon:yes stop_codon:yes gene_type:complete
MIDRHELLESIKEERKLRKLIREDLKKFLKNKRNEKSRITEDENRLRGLIKSLVQEISKTDVPSTQPHKNTGINVLEDLLKNIIPTIEDDYKALTSAQEQRESFRAHILKAVENSLTPAKIIADLPKGEDAAVGEELEEQDIKINVEDDTEDKFIPVRQQDVEPEEEEEEDVFSIPGADLTGRNFAASTYNKVEKQVLDAYESLANEEDRDLFYDYLLTNLKLYFDKFEDELQPSIEEPVSPDYEVQ